MRKAFLALFVITFLVQPAFTFAQDSTTSGLTNTPSPKPRENIQERIQTLKQNQEQARAASLERLKVAKTEWEQKRTELRTSLQNIKDERKKQLVENLNDKIADRNSNWVEHWNNVLKRLSDILNKIETKTNEAETNGKNVSSIKTAITAARSAISVAQSKIDAQAGKVYTISVSSESNLGSSVSSVVQQFHTDVKAVIDSINEARRSVQSVFAALKAVVGENGSPKPTVSASPTPTPTP